LGRDRMVTKVATTDLFVLTSMKNVENTHSEPAFISLSSDESVEECAMSLRRTSLVTLIHKVRRNLVGHARVNFEFADDDCDS
jgi:hypothetical protein